MGTTMPTVVIEVIVGKLADLALVCLRRWGWRLIQKQTLAQPAEQRAQEGPERSQGR
ncbi:hypothetical protein [Adonisia turfae]|uniref:hypothetical protein n=1 Tax=Adonisia turfae TaxID=2950184 RepID=UPI0013D6C0AB|nr:hypothetical protein [Adonisia turfae]